MDWAAEGTYPGAALGFGLVDPYDEHFCETNPRRAMFMYRELRRRRPSVSWQPSQLAFT